MAKKRREKKYKVCVSVSGPETGGRWRTVCKRLTKRQIDKLASIPKNIKGLKVTTF